MKLAAGPGLPVKEFPSSIIFVDVSAIRPEPPMKDHTLMTLQELRDLTNRQDLLEANHASTPIYVHPDIMDRKRAYIRGQ